MVQKWPLFSIDWMHQGDPIQLSKSTEYISAYASVYDTFIN